MFGSIVWFQTTLTNNLGVSGLFSNANYRILASFSITFSFYWLTTIKKLVFKLVFFILVLIIYMILFTYSRNALLSLFIIFFLLLGIKKHFKKFIFVHIYYSTNYFFEFNMQLEMNKYLPIKVIEKVFNTIDYSD